MPDHPASPDDPSPPPIRVKGHSIDWDEASLDALSTVTASDLDTAADLWRETAPAEYRGLIDAVGDETAGPGGGE